jgi:hypothetical protein
MADLSPTPQGVINQQAGVEANGDPDMYRLVKGRQPRNIGDIVNDPTRQAWFSTHNGKQYVGTFDAYEAGVLAAEQLTGVHTYSDGIKRDHGDVIIELMEFAIQWRKANNLPTTAKA